MNYFYSVKKKWKDKAFARGVDRDVITRGALHHGFDILDLRELLNEAGDYSSASPIEPSGQGGAKISAAIVRWVKRTA